MEQAKTPITNHMFTIPRDMFVQFKCLQHKFHWYGKYCNQTHFIVPDFEFYDSMNKIELEIAHNIW